MNSLLSMRLLRRILYFLFFALILQKVTAEKSSYRAAVFEYHPVREGGSHLEIIDKNIDNYILAIETAKSDKADIIVFPERGLLTLNVNKSTLASVATEVPNSKDQIVPCTDEQNNFQQYLKRLSCAARSSSMYLVVNLLEKDSPSEENLPNEERYFDTNVVFDRDGKVISTYRKYNVYNTADNNGDNYLDKPELGLSTFTTDFGVTFGHFICFDILFKSPGRDLVEQGITDFVYPTWWYSELPFLTAMQIQSAFSKAHKVNLLAADINYPEMGSTGSGIYRIFGNSMSFRTGVPTNSLLVSDVYRSSNFSPNQDFVKVHRFSSAEMPILDDISVEEPFWLFDDFTKYNSLNLMSDEKGRLELDQAVCHNEFCCHFKVSGRKIVVPEVNEYFRYKVVVFEGTRLYGAFRAGVQVCGIVACSNNDLTSCGKVQGMPQQPEVEFDSIVIERRNVSEKVNVFPTTLIYPPFLTPMDKDGYSFTRNPVETVQMKLLSDKQKELFSFAIYGRDESKDD